MRFNPLPVRLLQGMILTGIAHSGWTFDLKPLRALNYTFSKGDEKF